MTSTLASNQMSNLKWSESEKKLARRVFEAALEAELAEIMASFKAKASAVGTPDELWSMREFLETSQREVQRKYDYRYSQLILVFAGLVRAGRIKEEQLRGLSEEKLSHIRHIVSVMNRS
jgi:Photoprotection regulator fluorescence recovery protein